MEYTYTLAERERFDIKVRRTETCWIWTSTRDRQGYGTFRSQGKGKRAHRIAYEMSNGPIPDGMYVDHTCHVRDCVNPKHLRIVTPKQNSENRQGAWRNSTSGVRGVTWDSRGKKWVASVEHLGKKYTAGRFHTIEEAGAAAAAKRLELFTHSDADKTAA